MARGPVAALVWRTMNTNEPRCNGVQNRPGVAVGGSDARAKLAASVGGTLFFAGEATSSDGQGGTVNGALVTGERAAAEAAAALHARGDAR